MSHVLDVHKKRFTHYNTRPVAEVSAACNAGFNALPHETPPAEICDVPLLHVWFEIGQRAAMYVDHVKS